MWYDRHDLREAALKADVAAQEKRCRDLAKLRADPSFMRRLRSMMTG